MGDPGKQGLEEGGLGVQLTLRSPEMLAPARMPVAEGKKMENIPKKLPSGPRQSGTRFWTKMSPGNRGLSQGHLQDSVRSPGPAGQAGATSSSSWPQSPGPHPPGAQRIGQMGGQVAPLPTGRAPTLHLPR